MTSFVRKECLLKFSLFVLFVFQSSFADDCPPRVKKRCVKTLAEPYYERICSKKMQCVRIVVPCGPPGDPISCNYDEICIKYTTDCSNSTSTKLSSNKPVTPPIKCPVYYRCEWRPYWEVDLEMFMVKCTEYYTLKANESCEDVMERFILPLKVFTAFNPKLKCTKVKLGMRVCVHGSIKSKKPLCGTRRCAIGEECLPMNCQWKAKYGDKCRRKKCPLGHACTGSDGKICGFKGDDISYRKQRFWISENYVSASVVKQGSFKK